MQKVIDSGRKTTSTKELFRNGFMSGIGWSFGVTVGFVLISTIVIALLQALGGLPLIGEWIAAIVEETQAQLIRRTPVFPGY